MKKLLLATLLVASSSQAMAQQEITFATEPSYPPFETTNVQGEIIGFDVDVANAICKQIDATCHFKGEAFDALIPSLIKHRGGFQAAIAAIDVTEARAKKVAFTVPYYDSTASFIGLDGKMKMDEVKKVGVQNGTTFQQYLVAQGDRFEIKPYASIQDAILDVKNGRIDAVFGDTVVLADSLKQEASLNFVGQRVNDAKFFGNGFAIAVNKGDKKLLAELNKGIELIKQNGEYQKIYDKWFAK